MLYPHELARLVVELPLCRLLRLVAHCLRRDLDVDDLRFWVWDLEEQSNVSET